MNPRSRTRLALLVVVGILPLAAAETLPPPPLPAEDPTPQELPALPSDTELNLREGGFTFQGHPENPRRIALALEDGTSAFEYRLEDDGRARIDAAGQNILADATLVEVQGTPTEDSFALVVLDTSGALHHIRIDRKALDAAPPAPPTPGTPDLPVALPIVQVTRPPDWPRAPAEEHLLYMEDGEANRLAPAALKGTKFLRMDSPHSAIVQMPAAEATFDRIILETRAATATQTNNATFKLLRTTEEAKSYTATFLPSTLGAQNGDTIAATVHYERQLAPLVVERFTEASTYTYRVDGASPSIVIQAPDRADTFYFSVSWNGDDKLSAPVRFVVDQRIAGTPTWTRWVDPTHATSAVFSGNWGTTYEFRARSVDGVGNPSPDAFGSTIVAPMPSGSDDINDPPSARILTPRAGSAVAGLVSVTWTAMDPDGTPVTSKLEVSADEGDTWRILYVGPATTTTWDTATETDGPGYRLRLTVSDGTQQAFDATSALTVRNVLASALAAPPGAGAPPASQTPAPAAPERAQPASADTVANDAEPAKEKKGVPAPFAGIAILAAAFALRRKRS